MGEENPSLVKRVTAIPTDTKAETFALTFPVALEAAIEPEADGGCLASVPSLPGCFTETDDLDGLRTSLIEAAKRELEARRAL